MKWAKVLTKLFLLFIRTIHGMIQWKGECEKNWGIFYMLSGRGFSSHKLRCTQTDVVWKAWVSRTLSRALLLSNTIHIRLRLPQPATCPTNNYEKQVHCTQHVPSIDSDANTSWQSTIFPPKIFTLARLCPINWKGVVLSCMFRALAGVRLVVC